MSWKKTFFKPGKDTKKMSSHKIVSFFWFLNTGFHTGFAKQEKVVNCKSHRGWTCTNSSIFRTFKQDLIVKQWKKGKINSQKIFYCFRLNHIFSVKITVWAEKNSKRIPTCVFWLDKSQNSPRLAWTLHDIT